MKSKLVNRSIVFFFGWAFVALPEKKGTKRLHLKVGPVQYISTNAMCCTSYSPLDDWRDFNSIYGVKAFINIPARAAVFSRYMHNTIWPFKFSCRTMIRFFFFFTGN